MVRDWLSGLRKTFIGACIILAAAASTSQAEDLTADLRKLIEEQSKQIQELKQRLDSADQVKVNDGAEADAPKAAAPGDAAVKKIVADYLKEQDAKKKKSDADAKTKAEEEGVPMGSALNMSARWNPAMGNGLTFETPNKDFRIHIGGRFNFDTVFWNQSDWTQSRNIPTGVGGVNNFQDGMFFRRLRVQMDGQFWEVFEFNNEFQFEQVQAHAIPNLDEFWVGIQKVPVLGTIRIGHLKTQQGLESLSSSKVLTFLERSPVFDAFWQEFGPGIWVTNTFADQHGTVGAQVLRQESSNDGANFGDGQYMYAARGTILPLYENEGRCLLHLGASYVYHTRTPGEADNAIIPQTPFPANSNIRYRARPAMRDAQGSFSGAGVTGSDGNATRLIDTGTLNADNAQNIAAELFFVRGPFWLQAEANYAYTQGNRLPVAVDPRGHLVPLTTAVNAGGIVGPGFTGAGPNVGSRSFYGYYVMAGYFLTGENRTYDRRLGRVGSNYVSRIHTPFWALRDDTGKSIFGRGAWELAARYTYVNLDDQNVVGGKLTEYTLGLNWYLSPNCKIQFQYINDERAGLFPVGRIAPNTPGIQPAPAQGLQGFPGWVTGFGIRTALEF